MDDRDTLGVSQIGRMMRVVRVLAGVSSVHLASSLDVNPKHLARIESGSLESVSGNVARSFVQFIANQEAFKNSGVDDQLTQLFKDAFEHLMWGESIPVHDATANPQVAIADFARDYELGLGQERLAGAIAYAVMLARDRPVDRHLLQVVHQIAHCRMTLGDPLFSFRIAEQAWGIARDIDDVERLWASFRIAIHRRFLPNNDSLESADEFRRLLLDHRKLVSSLSISDPDRVYSQTLVTLEHTIAREIVAVLCAYCLYKGFVRKPPSDVLHLASLGISTMENLQSSLVREGRRNRSMYVALEKAFVMGEPTLRDRARLADLAEIDESYAVTGELSRYRTLAVSLIADGRPRDAGRYIDRGAELASRFGMGLAEGGFDRLRALILQPPLESAPST